MVDKEPNLPHLLSQALLNKFCRRSCVQCLLLPIKLVLTGSAKADILTGTNARGILNSFASNGKLSSNGGNNEVSGGGGNATINAEGGADYVEAKNPPESASINLELTPQ